MGTCRFVEVAIRGKKKRQAVAGEHKKGEAIAPPLLLEFALLR